jgi:hypothetical protein
MVHFTKTLSMRMIKVAEIEPASFAGKFPAFLQDSGVYVSGTITPDDASQTN